MKGIKSNHKILLIIISLLLFICCNWKKKDKEIYCTADDFVKMEKIDIHCHINVDRPDFMEEAVANNFKILTINTDVDEYLGIEEQQELALKQIKAFPDNLAYLTSFRLKDWNDSNFQRKTIAYLDSSFKYGAIGVKVWKNIGMIEKDEDGKFIMIDNPKLDPIFDYIEKMGKTVCGHLGEPKNCWLPIDSMTVNNDKKYYAEFPEYHMYLHPEFPSYDDQIEARDNMLKKHPNLRFVGAHLGSLEWSVDELAKHLDMFPNMAVDMAARICHIEKQSQSDWQKVRDFFIKYQDRIIYGTDGNDNWGTDNDPVTMRKHIREVWIRDWNYLTTDDFMTSWEVDGQFKGIKLPKDVIEKIYYKNAVNWFPGI